MSGISNFPEDHLVFCCKKAAYPLWNQIVERLVAIVLESQAISSSIAYHRCATRGSWGSRSAPLSANERKCLFVLLSLFNKGRFPKIERLDFDNFPEAYPRTSLFFLCHGAIHIVCTQNFRNFNPPFPFYEEVRFLDKPPV